jgi:hypothetical protein
LIFPHAFIDWDYRGGEEVGEWKSKLLLMEDSEGFNSP